MFQDKEAPTPVVNVCDVGPPCNDNIEAAYVLSYSAFMFNSEAELQSREIEDNQLDIEVSANFIRECFGWDGYYLLRRDGFSLFIQRYCFKHFGFIESCFIAATFTRC